MTQFIAHRQEHGQSLAAVIHTRLHLSWTEAKELIAKRQVKVAGLTCADPARRITKGQPIELTILPRKTQSVVPVLVPSLPADEPQVDS